jgi:hypothetical protein
MLLLGRATVNLGLLQAADLGQSSSRSPSTPEYRDDQTTVTAVRLRLEAWRPLLEGPAWIGLLLPILVHTPDPAIEARIARLPAEAKHHLAEAYRHIPTAVAALREHFLPARLVAAATSSRIH